MKRILLLGACFSTLAACSQHKDTAPTSAAKSERWVTSSSAAPAPVVNSFDCNGPVGPSDSAKALLAKYGADAALGDIAGAEGMTTKGLILYGKDPTRRLEITYWDDAMEHVSSVAAGEAAKGWTGPRGLHIGSSVADAEAANGKPFSIAGFGWDYGGYATDLKGGKLSGLPGGCSLQLRFDSGDVVPDGISGDGVTVASNDPRVKKYAPTVSEIAVGWPLPDGVKPSADDGGGD